MIYERKKSELKTGLEKFSCTALARQPSDFLLNPRLRNTGVEKMAEIAFLNHKALRKFRLLKRELGIEIKRM